jgi:hypothetical protein
LPRFCQQLWIKSNRKRTGAAYRDSSPDSHEWRAEGSETARVNAKGLMLKSPAKGQKTLAEDSPGRIKGNTIISAAMPQARAHRKTSPCILNDGAIEAKVR